MQNNESHSADHSRSPEPSHDGSSRGIQLSTKLIAQLEKLAPWRIKPSLIKFPTGTPEFHGGYAMVSRAFLNYSPDGEDDMRVSNNPGDEVMGSNGQNLKSPRHVSNLENNMMYRGEGRENEEVKESGASPHVMSSPSTNPDYLLGKRGELPPWVSSIHGGPTSRASFGSVNRGVCVAEGVKQESSGTSGARKAVAVKQIRIYQDLLRVLGRSGVLGRPFSYKHHQARRIR